MEVLTGRLLAWWVLPRWGEPRAGAPGARPARGGQPGGAARLSRVPRGGAQVKTLPFCRHSFHADCLLPWLRQQGRGAFCPLCKTPVFSQSA